MSAHSRPNLDLLFQCTFSGKHVQLVGTSIGCYVIVLLGNIRMSRFSVQLDDLEANSLLPVAEISESSRNVSNSASEERCSCWRSWSSSRRHHQSQLTYIHWWAHSVSQLTYTDELILLVLLIVSDVMIVADLCSLLIITDHPRSISANTIYSTNSLRTCTSK